MEPIRVFLGYDPQEPAAFHVAAHSIHRHASAPVTVAPLMLSQLAGVFSRPRAPRQSSDYAFTRFLVPHLCGYRGWAVFADCAVLFRADISDLWVHRDSRFAVLVVQHEHRQETIPFLGNPQAASPRKGWSSVILFNNARCATLSPEYVATAAAADLHRFGWLRDEEVGALPPCWNHLVGQCPDQAGMSAKALNYAGGGPWLAGCRGGRFDTPWWDELGMALGPLDDELLPARRAA